MKFKHVVGEKVLCFEPDETKARVLYNAKIMDADVIKDIKGKKFVEYKIHFQGWNHAWDRWADESFVLKDNDQNRKLQRKLARRAIKKLKLQKGRRRHHLPGVASKPDAEIPNNSDSSSGESFNSDFTTSTGTREKLSESDDDFPPEKRPRLSSTSTIGTASIHHHDNIVEEDNPSNKDEHHLRRLVSLDIPLSLQRRLEEDNALVKKRNMLINLPARPNVIQILENYVKRFAIHALNAADRQRVTTTAMGQPVGPEILLPPAKRLNLCEEVCCDLKLLFDYALPLSLLYLPERNQFKHLAKNTAIRTPGMDANQPPEIKADTTKKQLVFEDSPTSESGSQMIKQEEFMTNTTENINEETGNIQTTSLAEHPDVSSVSSSSPKKRNISESTSSPTRNQENPRPHKKKTAEEQLIEETHKYLIPNQPNLDQTGLSKDAQGRRRSSRLSHHESTSHQQSPTEPDTSMYRMISSATSSFQTRDLSPDPKYFVSIEPCIFLRAPSKHNRHSSIGASATINSEGPSCSTAPLRQPLFNANPCMDRDQYLSAAGSDIKYMVELKKSWDWCILPETFRPEEGAAVPPSMIYGIHHLLRLFVKLPEILMKMEIPEFKLKILIKHLNSLLKFLSEYERELFEVDAYEQI
ncbi:MSL complex subunit 3-like isoform X3 [Styela clava]